jgi:hypothetical protein
VTPALPGPVGYVALTFDDGPTATHTAALLDALRSCGARATLFNIGRNARDEPALVLAQRAAGMWLGKVEIVRCSRGPAVFRMPEDSHPPTWHRRPSMDS